MYFPFYPPPGGGISLVGENRARRIEMKKKEKEKRKLKSVKEKGKKYERRLIVMIWERSNENFF